MARIFFFTKLSVLSRCAHLPRILASKETHTIVDFANAFNESFYEQEISHPVIGRQVLLHLSDPGQKNRCPQADFSDPQSLFSDLSSWPHNDTDANRDGWRRGHACKKTERSGDRGAVAEGAGLDHRER